MFQVHEEHEYLWFFVVSLCFGIVQKSLALETYWASAGHCFHDANHYHIIPPPTLRLFPNSGHALGAFQHYEVNVKSPWGGLVLPAKYKTTPHVLPAKVLFRKKQKNFGWIQHFPGRIPLFWTLHIFRGKRKSTTKFLYIIGIWPHLKAAKVCIGRPEKLTPLSPQNKVPWGSWNPDQA